MHGNISWRRNQSSEGPEYAPIRNHRSTKAVNAQLQWLEQKNQESEPVTHLQITVFVDKDIGGFEITMNNTSRMNVFQTPQDLVQEVLDELLLKWSGCKKTVKIGSEEFCDKIAVRESVSTGT